VESQERRGAFVVCVLSSWLTSSRPGWSGNGPQAPRPHAPTTTTFGGTARLEPDITADRPRPRLGDLLVTNGWVPARDGRERGRAGAEPAASSQTLIADGMLDEITLARAISEQSRRRGRRHPRHPADPDATAQW